MKQKLLLTITLWLTLLGSAWAQSNNALHFDGSNDYVDLPDFTTTHDFSQGFTFSAWVKWDAFTGNARVFEIGNGNGSVNNSIILRTDNSTGKLMLQCSNGTANKEIVTDAAVVTTGTWHHVAATISSTGTATIYIDGTAVKSGPVYIPNNVNRANNWLGKSAWSVDNYFKGTMDEVSIWHKALTQAEIEAIKQTSPIGNENKIAAYYNFNQGTAAGNNSGITTLTDATANGKNGTLTNFALSGTTSNWVAGFVAGATPTYTLSATPTTFSLAGTSGSNGSISITSNTAWTISGSEDWLHVSNTSGSGNGAVTISSLSNNTGTAPRSATLTITGTGVAEPVTVTVTQAVFTATLSATPTTLSLAGTSGSNGSISISSNTAWTISGSEDWLHVSATSGSGNGAVTFTAISDLQQPIRTATYTLTGTGVTEPITITVSQTSNNALHFDGTDDYVTCPALNPEEMTIEAWVYLTETGREQVLFSTYNSTAKTGLELIIGTSNQPFVRAGLGTRIQTFSKPVTPLEVNTWVHIAINIQIYNGMTIANLFINGQYKFGIVASGGLYVPGNNNLILGCSADNGTPNRFFSGKMDELRVWNKKLLEDDIYNSMNKTLTGTEEGLLAYYKFNQGVAYANNSSVTTLADATAAANHGTLNNFALSGIKSNWVERNSSLSISAQPNPLSISYQQGSIGTLSIASSTNWTIEGTVPQWLQLSQTSGSGNQSVTFTALTENISGESRNATLSIIGEGITEPISLTVTQQSYVPTLTASQTELTLDYFAGSSQAIDITSDIDWTIEGTVPQWLQLSQTSGSGNATITLTTAEWNTNAETRTATLTLSGTGVSQPIAITITQAAYIPIAVSHRTVMLGGNAGSSQAITLTTNKQWQHSHTAGWFTVSPGTGNGSATITLSATATNSTSQVRSTLLNLYTNDNEEAMVAVYQAPSTASLSATITKTDGTQYAVTDAASLCHAIGSTPLKDVKGIELTGGVFPAYEWQWLKDNRSYLSRLTSVTITEGVTEVSNTRSAFNAIFNSTIEQLNIHGITEIKFSDFYGCASLRSVSFPMATSIGSYAFYSCTSLNTVNFPLVESIAVNSFYGCTALSIANFPMVMSIADGAFITCTALSTVNFPLVMSIGRGAFATCTALSAANFPSATSIGNNAFLSCTALNTVNFPMATSIGGSAFDGCTALSTANLPMAASIGDWAFDGCTTLSSIVLGTVPPATIGTNAFTNGPAIRYLSIANATGSELTAAYATYKAAPDGNTTDNLWYGWTIESNTPRQTISADAALTNAGHTLSPTGLMPAGVTIPLAVIPAVGYRMVPESMVVYKTGDQNTTVPVINGAVTMPVYDITVTATFELQPYAVLANADMQHGTVLASPNTEVTMGTEVTLSITPAAGYRYVAGTLKAYRTGSPSVELSLTEQPNGNYSFTMPAHLVSVTAQFEPLPQTLSVQTVANGTITATPSENIVTDTEIVINVTPNTGYRYKPNSLRAYKTGDENVTVDIFNGRIIMPAFGVTVTAEFEGLPQVLTFETVANGTIGTATPNEDIVTGAEITIITTPTDGYQLVANSLRAYKTDDKSVTVDIVEGKITMPAFGVTVTAEFEALPQVLTIATVANGTITATPSEGIVTDMEITLTTTANQGYQLVANSLRAYKTGDESVVVDIVGGKITMPAFGVTVTAEFEGLPQVLTFETVANGTIGTATPNEDIVTGAEITITTTPTAGYQLVENSLRAYKTGDESVAVDIVDGKITMPAFDVTVTAEFEALPQVLTIATVANGTITATPSENIFTDTEITVATSANQGYQLVENSLRAYKTDDETVTVDIVEGKITMPAFGVTVTAEFEAIPQVLTVQTVANGIITATPNENIFTDTEITVTTTANQGYQLVANSLRAHKTGDESVAVDIVDGKITMPAFDVTVTAEFEALPQVLTIATVANGTITATPSEGIVTDMEITLFTNPNAGYRLKTNSLKAHKTGDEATTVTITNGKFTMPAFGVTITAQFEAIPANKYAISIATLTNGTIATNPSGSAEEGAEVTLTITPANGYQLAANSLKAHKTGDEATTVTITDGKFTMPAFGVTITAQFEAIPANKYAISIATLTNGTIATNPSGSAEEGAEVTLTITPANGYQLAANSLKAHKTGDEATTVTITNGKFTMPAFGVTITAQFEAIPANKYAISIATLTNGTIATNPSGSAEEGAEVTLTITPANGYQLAANSLKAHKTGDEATTVTITDGKFTMPAYGVTVTAEFELSTGIDNNNTATVSAYPNPFTDYLVIESEEQIRSVSFINLLGKTVQHVSMPQAQIPTQNLLPGIYLVKVDFAKGKPVVIRMVKQ